MDERWRWCYSVAFILRQQVPTIMMDTLYSPELSFVTAEAGGSVSGNVSWVSLPRIP